MSWITDRPNDRGPEILAAFIRASFGLCSDPMHLLLRDMLEVRRTLEVVPYGEGSPCKPRLSHLNLKGAYSCSENRYRQGGGNFCTLIRRVLGKGQTGAKWTSESEMAPLAVVVFRKIIFYHRNYDAIAKPSNLCALLFSM